MKIRATLFLACLLLAACGQKGALYMPDDARQTAVPVNPDDDPDENEAQQQQGTAGNPAGN